MTPRGKQASLALRLISITLGVFLLLPSFFPTYFAHAFNEDPGLVSGNAVIDRTSVPGQTILKYQTEGATTFAAPTGVTSVRILVVAGGGAGGNNYAGGGGAGEVIHSTDETVTPGNPMTITVGAGGAACPAETFCIGGSGQDSSFGSVIVAKGGGGGGSGNGNGSSIAPTSGGSGGGAGGFANDAAAQGAPAGTVGTTGSNGTSARNAGGNGAGVVTPGTKAGGGGGGAGVVGAVGTESGGGAGGNGTQIDITGTNTYYGGGGGGGSNRSPDQATNTGGSGGLGGGGAGGWDTIVESFAGTDSFGRPGMPNTGGGGGGSSQVTQAAIATQGGVGGSGVVIIRFTTQTGSVIGDGTPGNPYQISDCELLQAVQTDLDAHFILTQDIDCSDTVNWNAGAGFDPIGSLTSFPTNAFTGSLNGQGFTISDLYINRGGGNGAGLFGLAYDVQISNLSLTNVQITGGQFSTAGLVGAHCASVSGASVINNVSVTGTVTGQNGVGGIASATECNTGDIINSHSEANVNGDFAIGGLAGSVHEGNITNSYATGSVTGEGDVGGLVGATGGNANITDSYATGAVSGDFTAGGLVGENDEATITSSYATSNVVGINRIGGLAGTNDDGTITASYATGNVDGEEDGGGLVGYNDDGTIEHSFATGSVTGGQASQRVGGFVGRNSDGTISTSYALGNVSGNSRVGGFAGASGGDSVISDSYARGSVTGNDNVGGFAGRSGATIAKSYSTGLVTGSADVGGFLGFTDTNGQPITTNSFWDMQTSGQATSAGGEGKTTAEMKNIVTYPRVVTPVTFDSYSWVTANDEPDRDPISWTLHGSNDGTNWTLLDTKTDQTITSSRLTETGTYALSGDVTYQFVKWEIIKRRAAGDGTIQAAELKLHRDGAAVAWPGTSAATNPDGDSCCGEGPQEAIDGDPNTKWLDFGFDDDGGDGQTGLSKLVINTGTAAWNIELTSQNLNDGYPFLSWQVGDSSPTWYVYGTATEEPDTDGDSIPDDIENAAPNNGDANNDGTLDSDQGHVASLVNHITDSYAVLELDAACQIDTVSMAAETNNTDSGFNYPAGLMNFTADCGTSGYTTNVNLYHYGITNDNFVLRKYKPDTSAYFTVNGATLSHVTIGGQTATKATYQAKDGGDLDLDGTANGIIIDPVGLAQSVVGAPNTGLGGRR